MTVPKEILAVERPKNTVVVPYGKNLVVRSVSKIHLSAKVATPDLHSPPICPYRRKRGIS